MTRCHDDVCVTCSDRAVPMRVRELIGDGMALAGQLAGPYAGRDEPEEISVALVEVKPGDVVLVHAMEAIAVVKEPEGESGSREP
jgi:hypothetical protein